MTLFTRPYQHFALIGERPRRRRRALALIATTSAVAFAADLLRGLVVTRHITFGSFIIPPLFFGFWWLSAWCIAAGARLMGQPSRAGTLLTVSADAFPAFSLYALALLTSAILAQWDTPSAHVANAVIGWCAVLIVAWFITLTVAAIRTVYALPTLNAISLALLPSAAITTILLLFVVIVSFFHMLGVL